MVFLDALLRFSTVGLLAVLLVLLLRDARGLRIAPIGAALCIAHIAQAVFATPVVLAPPREIAVISAFLAVPAPALLWLFWLMLLDDDVRIRLPQVSVVFVASLFKLSWALEYVGIALPFQPLRYALTYGVGIGLMAHIVYRALAGWRDDLVEARRRTRVLIAVAVACAGALNLAVELSGISESIELILGNTLALSSLLVILMWMLTLDEGLLGASHAAEGSPNLDDVSIPSRDIPAYKRLMAAMNEDRVYLRSDLTVAQLADFIGLPEHQLRKLVNRTLGHRNFAAFVNGYRLQHCKMMLANPGLARLPILTIAFDSGFQTLSTFNRAFRQQMGETPTEFRTRLVDYGEFSDEQMVS